MIVRHIAVGVLACFFAAIAQAAEPDLSAIVRSFANPPAQARPWVYWTWIDGNVNKAGITADLEAMQRVGIGGALILDVDQSTPHGPIRFFDAQWQDIFKHTVSEAKRLGMEINVNNGPGYYGSGGPWVPREKGMQTVVASETHINGGNTWTGRLVKPSSNPEYKDIAVMAVAEDAKPNNAIADFQMKALMWRNWVAYRGTESAALDAIGGAPPIAMDKVVDLTGKMDANGNLTWDAPAGGWTILRLGHQWTGRVVGPAIAAETGPETDKFDKAATQLHFNAFVKRLNEIVGPDMKSALVATHIDSWEGGGQNWSHNLRDEFKKRRGYDIMPYLPVLTNRVLGDLQTTERFLYDLRKTASELMIENYTAEFRRLAHENGLRFTFESYTTMGQDLDNAMFTDEPMAEFWTPNGQGLDFQPTVKSMSSAAHLDGRAIVGAEAFTSGNREKFMWTPAMIKSIGDNAFVGGVNRFVFHRYAAQPFADGVKPGMQMGPWGLHYERTNTWWDFTLPWHTYLARCQYMLRQGTFVGDILALQSEDPLLRFKDLKFTGYDYDVVGPDTFLRGKIDGSSLAFPGGTKYRLIVLHAKRTMTVGLLRHIRDLVLSGMAVLGEPPEQTPGLTDFPNADAELKKLTQEIWGADPLSKDRVFGKGRVFRGITAEDALDRLGVAPDFSSDSDIKYNHHLLGNVDMYFLSHPGNTATVATCIFRVAGKVPVLWDAETGHITPLRIYSTGGKTTTISIPFEPSGSAFIVFKPGLPEVPVLAGATRNGVAIFSQGVIAEPTEEPPIDLVRREISQPGTYALTDSGNRSREITVPDLPAALTVGGPWELSFPPNWGAPPKVTLETLIPWNNHPDSGVKYFSGTATYRKTLDIPPVGTGNRLYLDLGNVQVVARVRLNGRDLGVLWKPPYRVDMTGAVKTEVNALEIEVANNWVNRLIGDETLPVDSDRNTNGTLKSWPQWLLDGKPSPTGRLTFSSWRLWTGQDPLQDSGLIGPVTLYTVKQFDN